ncbi:MAG TPA: HD domain-containing protein [Candidatus Avidesulfovibrio excrementigallinarum]|nr:HD domain-containing protein [Candidatus Avidesulfovibrio excrementigallinarum]
MNTSHYSRALPWFNPVPWLDMADGSSDMGTGRIPSDEACFALHDRYGTMEHIRRHCLRVADLATAMAQRAVELYGIDDGQPRPAGMHPACPARLVATTRAAGLLHDLAKTYCIKHGGSHAQLGAAWVLEATGNHRIAQAVFLHVEWPWDFPNNVCSPALFVTYADRRVKHDTYVTVRERYCDLLERYAKTDACRRTTISSAYDRVLTLERALSAQLELPLHACTVDCGRLVPRA